MPDIGQTLRDARIRQRVDITDLEQETKIRAKYLRALENEEWDLLPGPAYTRSFLRAYADALGLDSRMLVEEYKLRHERITEQDLQPIRPAGRGGRRDPRRPPPRPLPRGAVVAAVVIALLAMLWVLGQGADEEPEQANRIAPPPAELQPTTTDRSAERDETRTGSSQRRRRSRTVRLQLVPSGPVWVCLMAGSERVIGGREVRSRTKTFRARRFRITLGNNNVVLRVNGRTVPVPASSEPIGYAITRNGRRPLSAEQRPTCS